MNPSLRETVNIEGVYMTYCNVNNVHYIFLDIAILCTHHFTCEDLRKQLESSFSSLALDIKLIEAEEFAEKCFKMKGRKRKHAGKIVKEKVNIILKKWIKQLYRVSAVKL